MVNNYEFYSTIIEYYNFPEQTKKELYNLEEKIKNTPTFEKCLNSVIKAYLFDKKIEITKVIIRLKLLALMFKVDAYLLNLVFIINCMPTVFDRYIEQGIDETLFWETFRDMEYKNAECLDVYGKSGTFVLNWYNGFLNVTRFTIGRFQFEKRTYKHHDITLKNGYTIHKGDVFLNMHIPSSKISITNEVRLESYKLAYEYFSDIHYGDKMIFGCESYLLHPSCAEILPNNSNLLSFYNDFEIVKSIDHKFRDGWRIFGSEYKNPLDKLPQNTTLQKNYVKYLKSGKKTGDGEGFFIFDGEKII